MKVHSCARDMNLNRKRVKKYVETQNFDVLENRSVNLFSYPRFSWYIGLNAPSIFLFKLYIP